MAEFYGLWMLMVGITLVNGVYKPTYNLGAPCCILPNILVVIIIQRVLNTAHLTSFVTCRFLVSCHSGPPKIDG